MNFRQIALFFIVISCAISPKIISRVDRIELQAEERWQGEQFAADLRLLKESPLRSYFNLLQKKISTIIIAKNNCVSDQVACVFPDQPRIIFLTLVFFDQPWHEKIGTLLHELRHHETEKYYHDNCTSKLISNTDCDVNSNGPFGAELHFYKDYLNIGHDRKTTQLVKESIRATAVRINSL